MSTRRPILSGFPASHLPHLEMAPLLRCQPYAQSCQDSQRHICHISKWHQSFGVNPTPNLVPSWYPYSRRCLHTGRGRTLPGVSPSWIQLASGLGRCSRRTESQLTLKSSAASHPQLLQPHIRNFCSLTSATSAASHPQLLQPHIRNFCSLTSATSACFSTSFCSGSFSTR